MRMMMGLAGKEKKKSTTKNAPYGTIMIEISHPGETATHRSMLYSALAIAEWLKLETCLSCTWIRDKCAHMLPDSQVRPRRLPATSVPTYIHAHTQDQGIDTTDEERKKERTGRTQVSGTSHVVFSPLGPPPPSPPPSRKSPKRRSAAVVLQKTVETNNNGRLGGG